MIKEEKLIFKYLILIPKMILIIIMQRIELNIKLFSTIKLKMELI
jgi:hypothetical protein